jgi:dTDP-4-dehydrorhamnose reductase
LNGSEENLEQALAVPYPQTIEMMKRLDGDLMILGVGGKVGASMAATARNALREAGVNKKIVGVDKVLTPKVKDYLEGLQVDLVQCDLSFYEEVMKLPKTENVLFLAGRKFGDVGSEPLTWLMNVIVPGNVAQYFDNSRIVAFSTGCVYDLRSGEQGGSVETDEPKPVGEYANSCLGRERVFEYFCEQNDSTVLLFRLNYSVDLRYGVIVEIARDVYEERPVNISVNHFNIMWQGDVVNRALLCLEHTQSPAAKLNVTGIAQLRTDEVAKKFGELFGKEVKFTGTDTNKAYLSNAQRSVALFGPPQVGEEQLIEMVADWIQAGGPGLDKPTHFSVTDGQFLDEKK